MSKKEIAIYAAAILLFLLAIVLFKYAQVQFFYGGDTRCIFAECRINK